ncbi:MAG: hypothetical protein U0892_14865 [Pirellulales bacterium]
MTPSLIRSITQDVPEAALGFLFEPRHTARLVFVRRGIMAVACAWLVSMLAGLSWWFGPAGWLDAELSSRLATSAGDGLERFFMFSPLWWTSDRTIIGAWFILSLLLCIAGLIGIGGRWIVAASFVAVLCCVQRTPWTTGAVEPLLLATMAYLVIEPGSGSKNNGSASKSSSTAAIALRMIQIHLWLFLLFGLLTQCSGLTWWRGEAVWWLTRTGHSNLLRPEWLHGKGFLINAITHGVTLVEFIAVAGLWNRLLRPIAYVSGLATAASYALLADQFLYGLLIVVLLDAFRSQQTQSGE